MQLDKLYNKIKLNIDKINFDAIWEGFMPLKFALYNETECYFDGEYIEKTQDFLANTSILFNGEYIAIWNVTDDISLEILTSKIVHEMFHGYQMINNEARFPNELEALTKYRYQDENLSLKLKENEIINSLIVSFNINDYNELLKIRKYRSIKFDYEYIYETKIEQIEGAANYVELMVLKQISTQKFNKKLIDMKQNIINKCGFLPIRIISYDIGALLLLLLNENKIDVDMTFNNEPFSYQLIKNVDFENVSHESLFMNNIKNYYERADKLIRQNVTDENIAVSTPFKLLGVNVYNAICYNSFIISTYFVRYSIGDVEMLLNGDYIIELENGRGKKIYKINKL